MSIRFTALTVRDGDAFLLEDDGWNCLFDSGEDESIFDLLEYKGIKKLDLAICSHNDADHAKGFIELLEKGFPISEIWLPGLWASVLLFVKENGMNRGDIELGDDVFNGELDSLFSEESVPEDSFNQELSFFGDLKDTNEFCKKTRQVHNDLSDKLVQLVSKDDSFSEKWKSYFNRIDPEDDSYFFFHYRGSSFLGLSYSREQILEECQRGLCLFLNSSFDIILRIASLAKRKCRKIRWFEPSSGCTKERIDYGFVSLNSSKMCSIRMPKNEMAYLYLLQLTKVNKYSLVFDYTKNDVPIIRFSADSDSICQSVNPYPKSIIVTAPHHGSKANAKVYKAINGNDLIWVRSDERSYRRPCDEFKAQKSKYCLACDKYNFVSEICFEYNPVTEKWDYVHGEPCRC